MTHYIAYNIPVFEIHLIILHVLLSTEFRKGLHMSKLELMKKFSSTFVGNGFHLVIRENGDSFLVHTIEIMEKTDETCPVKGIPVGDYFFHLVAENQHGNEASIVCDWSQELLQSLLENYRSARESGCTHIEMFRNPLTNDPNDWMLKWRSLEERPKPGQITYIC
jgi:hypothetical protein